MMQLTTGRPVRQYKRPRGRSGAAPRSAAAQPAASGAAGPRAYVMLESGSESEAEPRYRAGAYVNLDSDSEAEAERKDPSSEYVKLDSDSCSEAEAEASEAYRAGPSPVKPVTSVMLARQPWVADKAIAAARAMLTRDPWMASETLFETLWRADSRPPREIKLTGFAGTNTTEHAITLHENDRTVFSSRTPAGVLKFIREEKAAGSPLQYFLYKIKVNGLRASSFQRNLDRFGARFVYDLARLEQQRLARYLEPGEEKHSLDTLSQIVAYQLERAYIPVDEVHIQGPISPVRITHVQADDPDLENVYVRRSPDKDGSPRLRRSNSF